jgi:hypothetical protein
MPLSHDSPTARRHAALLHDVVRAGGWLTDSQIALRCALYALPEDALTQLASAEPPVLVRDEGGWAITSPGLRQVTAWEQRERAEIRRSPGPQAAA